MPVIVGAIFIAPAELDAAEEVADDALDVAELATELETDDDTPAAAAVPLVPAASALPPPPPQPVNAAQDTPINVHAAISVLRTFANI